MKSVYIEGREISIEGMTEAEVIRVMATSMFLEEHSAKCDCYDCREAMIDDILDSWED